MEISSGDSSGSVNEGGIGRGADEERIKIIRFRHTKNCGLFSEKDENFCIHSFLKCGSWV